MYHGQRRLLSLSYAKDRMIHNDMANPKTGWSFSYMKASPHMLDHQHLAETLLANIAHENMFHQSINTDDVFIRL